MGRCSARDRWHVTRSNPRRACVTESCCAVLFCSVAAYMGASFTSNGDFGCLESFHDELSLYNYGAWDEAVTESEYPFRHEALMTTFGDVEREVSQGWG